MTPAAERPKIDVQRIISALETSSLLVLHDVCFTGDYFNLMLAKNKQENQTSTAVKVKFGSTTCDDRSGNVLHPGVQ